MAKHWRGVESLSLEILRTWPSLEQPAINGPALSRGFNQRASKGFFQPALFCGSVMSDIQSSAVQIQHGLSRNEGWFWLESLEFFWWEYLCLCSPNSYLVFVGWKSILRTCSGYDPISLNHPKVVLQKIFSVGKSEVFAWGGFVRVNCVDPDGLCYWR